MKTVPSCVIRLSWTGLDGEDVHFDPVCERHDPSAKPQRGFPCSNRRLVDRLDAGASSRVVVAPFHRRVIVTRSNPYRPDMPRCSRPTSWHPPWPAYVPGRHGGSSHGPHHRSVRLRRQPSGMSAPSPSACRPSDSNHSNWKRGRQTAERSPSKSVSNYAYLSALGAHKIRSESYKTDTPCYRWRGRAPESVYGRRSRTIHRLVP